MMHRTLALAGAATLGWSAFGSAGCTKLETASAVVLTAGPGLERSMPDLMGYDGSIETMECVPLSFEERGFTEVTKVELSVAINHPWAGDLVIKVVSPRGTVTTVLSRPGFDEPADTDLPEGLESSHLAASDPITFRDGAPTPAEEMGAALQSDDVICRDDGRCAYAPSPDSGPGRSLADFQGEDPAGVWQVCIGDASSGDGDTGVIQMVELSLWVR